MSVQATTWVWEQSKAEGTTLLVALALADAANAQGERSCQSVATMAAMARTSERTVQRALRTLEQSGEIAPTGKDTRYRTTIYAFPALAAVGDNGDAPGVTDDQAVGDIAVSHYPRTTPQTDTPGNPTGAAAPPPDELQVKAREIVQWWWDGLPIKPAGRGAWFSATNTVHALLKAGHSAKAVAGALRSAGTPVSIPRLEIELGRSSKRTGMETQDEHYQQGGGFYQ